jgi:transposase
MKAYALDLRKRVVKFLNAGGSKAEAARRFDLGRRTVYRYLAAAQKGALAPKTSWGTWRKLDPQKLQAHVKGHPDATLKELQTVFGVSHHAVWVRLGRKRHAEPFNYPQVLTGAVENKLCADDQM